MILQNATLNIMQMVGFVMLGLFGVELFIWAALVLWRAIVDMWRSIKLTS
jgi:hypothetical protein